MAGKVIEDEMTFWEQMAATRWGQYLTEVERAAIECAAKRFPEPGHAFEVGCEGGRWSRLLADCGWRMTCTDIGAEKLAICQRRLPQATCILANPDEKRLPIDDKLFDLLLCIEVPVSEESWFAAELARVVRPGGIVVCTYHNRNSYRGKLKNFLRPHEIFYRTDYRACRRALVDNSFRIIEETGFCWFPFRRGSNSRLAPVAVQLERILGLRRFVRYSPWVIVIAERV